MIPRGLQPGATISPVKIRAVTLGLDLSMPEVDDASLASAGRFLNAARQAFERAGIEVQTLRVAGSNPRIGDQTRSWAKTTEAAAQSHGIEYLSLGRVGGSDHAFVADQLAPILAETQIAFFSADLIEGRLPSIPMAHACARAVKQLAASTDLGFGNLRFAATANCPPNIPFLPAAYHAGGLSRFSIAVQAADVVL